MTETAASFFEVSSPWTAALLIFAARLLDVSVGTIRIISVSRGSRLLSPLLGFFEVLIWLIAIRQIFEHLTSPVAYVAYAGGFAAGTWLGMLIDDKLALGLLSVQIITRRDATDLLEMLNRQDLGGTVVSARGAGGRVRMVLSVVKRRDLDRVIQSVEELHPTAFISISDVRSAREGVFPTRRTTGSVVERSLGWARKGK